MVERKQRIAVLRQKQPLAELERKAEKARMRSNLWSQEELDLGIAKANEMREAFGW